MRRWVRLAATVVVAAAVALVLAWSYSLTRGASRMVGVVAASGAAVLQVSDQVSAAGRLVVGRVVVPGDSWIVVTTSATDEAPSTRVGLAHVSLGETRDVTVTLGPGIAMNEKLVVTIHADRGVADRFEFDPTRFAESPDKPYYVNGLPLAATVVKDTAALSLAEADGASVSDEPTAAAGEAVLEVADRLTVINDLVIDRVVAPARAWAVVFLVAGDGTPGEIAGLAPVAAGETIGVAVPITTDALLTDKLLVALLADRGTVGRFEFTVEGFSRSPDKPFAVGGAELSRSVFLRGYGMNSGNAGDSGSGM